MTERTQTLNVGDPAPDFELTDQNNQTFKLSDRRALFVVDEGGTVRYIDSQENPGQNPNNEALFAALASV